MLHFKTIFLILNIFLITFNIFPKEKLKLIIDKQNKNLEFEVEIAKTKEERKKGLMYRNSLSKNQGMLFVFPKEKIIKMWMKNTFLPLDIIFISNKKIVVDLKYNMEKLSNSIIMSKLKSKYALEINAGLINKLDIKIGDKVFFYE